MAYDYEHLRVEIENRLATVTMDAPPINVITLALFAELSALSLELKADPRLTVVVLKSAHPDFFIAHFDVDVILSFPTEPAAEFDPELNAFHAMCERFRTMNKVTICQIEGRVGGGGSELASSCDMRFGVRDKTVMCQMEVPLGILPGGSGTQRLPRLMGRGRALEVILAGDDLDAETAERWGYLNRIFEADEIGPWVDKLARRIASFPPEAVRLAKQAVDGADLPLAEGLAQEAYLFQRLLRTDGAQRNMRKFMAMGGQTAEVELQVGAKGAELGDS